jgi:Do/DeqQ family serine protease
MKLFQTFFVAVAASLITYGVLRYFEQDKSRSIVVEQVTQVPSKMSHQTDSFGASNPSFSETAEKVTGGVVHIKATSMGNSSRLQRNNQFDIFREFFGDDFFSPYQMQPQPQQSSGSGVIINEEGFIVTNNHVVANATELEVTLYDKRTFSAKLIGADPSTDLAVIKIEAKNLSPLSFGNSDQVRVGEWVLAVGNPFNLESTVTAGIISAKGRNISILKDNRAIESFLQTDAAVNPGNSGGALVNLNGLLIGINTAIATPTGTFAGYSFAVPSNLVSKVVEDLIAYGKVQRALLGINIQTLDGETKKKLGLNTELNSGVYIAAIGKGGAADEAGLQQGDIITKIGEKEVRSVAELQEIVGRKRPGDKVKVTFERDGKIKTIEVLLKNEAGTTDITKAATLAEMLNLLGVEVEELNGREASRLGLEGGLKIKSLGKGLIKERTDIREGFIITEIDNKPTTTIKEFEQAIVAAKDKGKTYITGFYPGYRRELIYGLKF